MVRYGLSIQNFNISIINPILKKGNLANRPEDYRPISVSNVFCNIYEKLILLKIHTVFNFNEKQFGYKRFSSCKHASFVINETINYYKKICNLTLTLT
jgi:hypothetical protein